MLLDCGHDCYKVSIIVCLLSAKPKIGNHDFQQAHMSVIILKLPIVYNMSPMV